MSASFLGFGSVGFSGSRRLSGAAFGRCRSLAAAAVASGVGVSVGCARGADLAARLGAGSAASVFRVSSFGRGHKTFARRSGSWASAAFAVGLGVPVCVFLPAGVAPPSSWGAWVRVGSGALVGGWGLRPAAPVVQLGLL